MILSASAIAHGPSSPISLLLKLCARSREGSKSAHEASEKEKQKERNVLELRQCRVGLERLCDGARTLCRVCCRSGCVWVRDCEKGWGKNYKVSTRHARPARKKNKEGREAHFSSFSVALLLSAFATARAPSTPMLFALRLARRAYRGKKVTSEQKSFAVHREELTRF